MPKRKNIDEIALLTKRGEGKNLKKISEEMGVSVPTLSRRIAVLKYQKGILTKYRQLQGLQLTELQARILESINSEKIENASLADLLKAFHVLKKAEIAIRGKESFKVWGLLAHLQALESVEPRNGNEEKCG